MIFPGQCLGTADAVDPSSSIFISVVGCLAVPHPSLLEAGLHMDSNLVEIAHREFSRGQASRSRTLRVRKCHSFVLSEYAIISAEEPLADGHFRLWLVLSRSKIVIMKGKDRIKRAVKLGQLISGTHLDLRFREPKICRLLDIHSRRFKVVR
jgi:hypothetical protein